MDNIKDWQCLREDFNSQILDYFFFNVPSSFKICIITTHPHYILVNSAYFSMVGLIFAKHSIEQDSDEKNRKK